MNAAVAIAVLANALLICASAGAAGAAQLTPMEPGFHQHLQCTKGYVDIDVAADAHDGAHAVLFTTTISVGDKATTTTTIRTVDGQGNIFSVGYVIAAGVVKRFPKRLLLPATPPAAGERSAYYSVKGIVVEKRFEGTTATHDAQGRPATGYFFADYVGGNKLNLVTYVPSIGIVGARFFALMPDHSDFVCRLPA
jgi:hypothetical protein